MRKNINGPTKDSSKIEYEKWWGVYSEENKNLVCEYIFPNSKGLTAWVLSFCGRFLQLSSCCEHERSKSPIFEEKAFTKCYFSFDNCFCSLMGLILVVKSQTYFPLILPINFQFCQKIFVSGHSRDSAQSTKNRKIWD